MVAKWIRSARDRNLEGAGVVVEGVVVDAEVEPPAGADAEGQALGADEERVVGRSADAADQRARRTVGHGAPRRGRGGVEVAFGPERTIVAEGDGAGHGERDDVARGDVDAAVSPADVRG